MRMEGKRTARGTCGIVHRTGVSTTRLASGVGLRVGFEASSQGPLTPISLSGGSLTLVLRNLTFSHQTTLDLWHARKPSRVTSNEGIGIMRAAVDEKVGCRFLFGAGGTWRGGVMAG